MKDCWKVERVDVWSEIKGRGTKRQKNAHYHFHVQGVNHAGGSLAPARPEDFSWTVPDIKDEGFDLHDAEFTSEAAALAAELYGLAFLQARAGRAVRDFDPASLADTQEIPPEKIEAIVLHPERNPPISDEEIKRRRKELGGSPIVFNEPMYPPDKSGK